MTSADNRHAEGDTYTLAGLYRKGDRLMVAVLWAHAVLAFVLAGQYATWNEALVIGLPAAAVPTLLAWLLPGARITRVAVAIAFMVFSALVIHQAHGMIEMHFGIFVLLAFLLFYRDWLPILIAAGVIAVHHLSFNIMQAAGYPVFVFPEAGLHLVLIHAAYVVFETAILLYMVRSLYREAVQAEELHGIGAHLTVQDGQIDLTWRHPDATSDFAVGFNEFMEAVHGALSRADAATRRLGEAMQGLSGHAHETRDGAARQHAELDQVATAINEMSATSQEVARNTNSAAEVSGRADERAREGRQVVDDSVAAINGLSREIEQASGVVERLNGESASIGKVLEVITEIAEQTNLLALNAAIEAARAGEQGRGFAVVADEVRTLANRTHEPTQEIQGMIERLQAGAREAVGAMESSTSHTRDGVDKVSEAGRILGDMAEAIATINDMSGQIATAAEQQSATVEDVNRNVTNLTDEANRTAEGADEAVASTAELAEVTHEVRGMMERFRL